LNSLQTDKEGARTVFDEINNPEWPGETVALLECLNIRDVAIQKFPYDPTWPYIPIVTARRENCETVQTNVKTKRNDPCACGSGRKYKKCCMDKTPSSGRGPDIDRLFAEALRESNEGRLKQAEELCRQILAANPSHAGTLHLLGIVASQSGRDELAVELVRRAICLNPSVACYHNSLGAFLQKLNQIEDAVSEYRQALCLVPDYPDTLTNFGGLLYDLGRPEEALPHLEKAVALAPAHAKARTNLGLVLHALGRTEEGVQHSRKAVELAPQSVNIVQKCIAVLMGLERWAQAVPYFERWVELDPASTDAHLKLGDCYMHQDLRREAAAHYAKALAMKPDFAMAANNLGGFLISECRHADALVFCRKALDIKPDCADLWVNLGKLLKEVALVETALRCYDMALALEPGHIQALWGRSLCLLALGRLAEGWADYEWGWQAGARTPVRPFFHPRWNGQDPAGKTILVWMEQGLGDHILFASMLPDLIRAGAHCVVETESRLATLFERSFPTAEIVTWTDPPQPRTQQPDIGFQIPIASLARWFRPTIESFPPEPAYLVPDPVRVGHWRKQVDGLGEGLKVGICWRSMLHKGPRSMYYPRLDQWGPILTIPGIRFVNLQYDECEEELREAENSFGVRIHRWDDIDLRNDQEGVAALTSTLDLVISADSTPAEVAAALGMPTWVIARNTGWAYFGQNYSPWHPTYRLFLSGYTDPWELPIERAAHELKQLVLQCGLTQASSNVLMEA
jgi:tetratricopeptide (TPR) repeat protein